MGQLFLSGDASAAKDRAHKRCLGKRVVTPPQTQRTLSSGGAFRLALTKCWRFRRVFPDIFYGLCLTTRMLGLAGKLCIDVFCLQKGQVTYSHHLPIRLEVGASYSMALLSQVSISYPRVSRGSFSPGNGWFSYFFL